MEAVDGTTVPARWAAKSPLQDSSSPEEIDYEKHTATPELDFEHVPGSGCVRDSDSKHIVCSDSSIFCPARSRPLLL